MKTKAAVLYEYGKPLVIEELELSPPREQEVLVKNMAAGLCHTDLSVVNGVIRMPPLPCIPGHEGAGIVQEVGPGVTKVKPGDHVILMWVPVCGGCYYCLHDQPYLCEQKDKTRSGTMLDGTFRLQKGDLKIHSMLGVGCFSEFNVVSEKSIVPINNDFPFEVAALVGCGVITGVGAVLNKAKVKPGSSVAVIGVGGVGLNVIQGALLANATKIIAIDILDRKLELARSFGASHALNSSREDPYKKIMEITENRGVDYSFEAIGKAETTLLAYNLLRRGGSLVIMGVAEMEAKLNLPLYEIPLLEKNILGCNYGSGDPRLDLLMLLDLYKAGRIRLDELITKRYSLDEINIGFQELEAGQNIRGMIIFSGKG